MSVLINTPTEPNPLAVPGAAPWRAVRPLVVVAEDSQDERTMIGTMLGFLGYDVVLAVDGLDALDAVFIHGPDAVVCDMDMPNLDGLGLCRALRALRANQTLPIIVYTGAENGDPRVGDARALHGAEIVGKSLSVTKLGEVLGQMLTVAGGSAAA